MSCIKHEKCSLVMFAAREWADSHQYLHVFLLSYTCSFCSDSDRIFLMYSVTTSYVYQFNIDFRRQLRRNRRYQYQCIFVDIVYYIVGFITNIQYRPIILINKKLIFSVDFLEMFKPTPIRS